MQLSQLFRRGVIMPVTDSSAEQLSHWSIQNVVRVEFLPIATQELFDRIWDSRLFESINRNCLANIDDFEEEVIDSKSLQLAISCVRQAILSISDVDVTRFAMELLAMCEAGQKHGRSIYFIL